MLEGPYRGEWIDVLTGDAVKSVTLAHPGGRASIQSPGYDTDIALRLTATR